MHALPVFHALRAAHPGAEIGWAVQPEFASLVEKLRGLARVFRFERRGGARAWPSLWREIAAWSPDWAVDAQGNVKSAMVTLGSRAPRRSGLDRTDWAEPFAATSSTDAAPPARGSHAMDKMLALARHVAPGVDERLLARTDLDLDASEIARGAELCERFGLENGATILHLATPGDVRAWPAEECAELARLLAREPGGGPRRVLMISGPAEAALGREIGARLAHETRIVHWPGQRGLRELAALFTTAGRRGATFVGSDSGPMHLAWACGLRVVLLAGPQDEQRTGPWPVPEEVPIRDSVLVRDGLLVRDGAPVRDRRKGPGADHLVLRARPSPYCAPCLERACSHPEGPVCMRRIAPRDVAAALASVS